MSKTAAVAHLTSLWSDLFFRPNLPPPARALELEPGSDSRSTLLLLLLLLLPPANITPRFTAAFVCPAASPLVCRSQAPRGALTDKHGSQSHAWETTKEQRTPRGNSTETALPLSALLDHVFRACLFVRLPPILRIRQRGTLSSEGFHPARSLPRANRPSITHTSCAPVTVHSSESEVTTGNALHARTRTSCPSQ